MEKLLIRYESEAFFTSYPQYTQTPVRIVDNL
jgi:hypothetical protein